MNVASTIQGLYREAANGDQDAFQFLMLWHAHCHHIDDQVDEDVGADEVIEWHAHGLTLAASPFWLRHADTLLQTALLIANAYADSVELGESQSPGLQTWADSLRLAGNEMVVAVALLTGGFALARQISPRLRAIAWQSQHSEPDFHAVPSIPVPAATNP